MQFSQDLFDNICNDIATSSKGLDFICKKYGLNSRSFYRWIQNDSELSQKYACAREEQAEFMADEIVSIADDSSNDTKVIQKGNEVIEVENTEFVNRSKLRVEARKWIAAKLKPKKYGDKIETNITGTIEHISGMEIK
jgi:hypothetical protein